ncbi:MAG: hypothetical protein ABWK01_06850, partial [Infirmifilum sp.]
VATRAIGIALRRESKWLQSIDVHGVNLAATTGACTLCLPTIDRVENPAEVRVGEDVRFNVWLNCHGGRGEVGLRVSRLELLEPTKIVDLSGLAPCDQYSVRVDFGPIRFTEPGTYAWEATLKAGGHEEARSGVVSVLGGASNRSSEGVVVEERWVKGLGFVRVEAPSVMEPGREYEVVYQVSVDRGEFERLLWVLREICGLLCTLPWSQPYMPSALCRACGAEKFYVSAYGGLRGYKLLPEGSWGVSAFVALGLQTVHYSVPVGLRTYLVGSEIAELVSLHYVLDGVPPFSLSDIESRGFPYSLKVTPIGATPASLAGGSSLELRYRVELVPNEKYAGLFNLYGARAVYNSTVFAEDILSGLEASLRALQAARSGDEQRVSQLEGELSSCRSDLARLEGELESCRQALYGCGKQGESYGSPAHGSQPSGVEAGAYRAACIALVFLSAAAVLLAYELGRSRAVRATGAPR